MCDGVLGSISTRSVKPLAARSSRSGQADSPAPQLSGNLQFWRDQGLGLSHIAFLTLSGFAIIVMALGRRHVGLDPLEAERIFELPLGQAGPRACPDVPG